MRPLLAALLAVPVLLSGAAGAAESDGIELTTVNTSAYPHVRANVTVSHLLGSGLSDAEFTVVEGGEARPVQVRQLATGDLDVVLLFDTSGSMRANDAIEAARAAAIDFVGLVPPQARIALVAFASEPVVVSPFTQDRSQTVPAIQGLTAGGNTALFDAVGTGLDLLATTGQATAQQVIVLLSDGGDTASILNREETIAKLGPSGAALYVVELETPESDFVILSELAGVTGGKVVSTDDPAALTSVYAAVAAELFNRYEVAYQSAAHGPVELVVRAEAAGTVLEASRQITLPPAPPPEPEPPGLRPGVLFTPAWWAQPWLVTAGMVAFFLGAALLLVVVLVPRRQAAQPSDRAAVGSGGTAKGLMAALGERAGDRIERRLEKSGRMAAVNAALEAAALQLRPGEYIMVALVAILLGTGVGWAVGGPILAVVFGVLAAVAARWLVQFRAGRRRRRFGEQLPDTLQVLASSLRSGHGLLQAIDAVGREAESPTAEEFRRLVVESRLGKDVDTALEDMNGRVGGEDFPWVVQALQIHREVGGDLAEVLDAVAGTIREREQLRRQVKVLSAEGRLSAIILVALPFALAFMIFLLDREYILELTASGLGWFLLALGVALMIVGTVWIRRLVRLVF